MPVPEQVPPEGQVPEDESIVTNPDAESEYPDTETPEGEDEEEAPPESAPEGEDEDDEDVDDEYLDDDEFDGDEPDVRSKAVPTNEETITDVGTFTTEDLANTVEAVVSKALRPVLEQNAQLLAQNTELVSSNRALYKALESVGERQTAVEESVAKAVTAIGGVQEIAKGLTETKTIEAQQTPAPVRQGASERVIAPKPALENPEGTVVDDNSARVTKAMSDIRKLQQTRGTSIPKGFDFFDAVRAGKVDEALLKSVEAQIAERLN